MTMNNVPTNVPQIQLATAYIPYQQYREFYNVNEALYKGTIFKELFQPYRKPYQNPFNK